MLSRRGHTVLPDEWKMRYVEVPGADRAYYWHGVLHVRDKNGRVSRNPFYEGSGSLPNRDRGDSLTYGVGVDRRWAYPAVLEQQLKKDFRVEVINLGVPGLQSEDIGASLERLYEFDFS